MTLGKIDSLANCIQDINDWMSQNFLKLNQDKTEVLIIGSKAQREKLTPKLNILGLNLSKVAKNVGVVFDSVTISLSEQYRKMNACIYN